MAPSKRKKTPLRKKAAVRKKAVRARPVSDATSDLFAGDPAITPKIQAAFEAAIAKYAHRPGVTGVDVGLKMKAGRHTKEMAIRVHVEEKLPRGMVAAAMRYPRR